MDRSYAKIGYRWCTIAKVSSGEPSAPALHTLLFSGGQIMLGARCSRCTCRAARCSPKRGAGRGGIGGGGPRRIIHSCTEEGSIFAHVSRATTPHQGTSYWIAARTIFPSQLPAQKRIQTGISLPFHRIKKIYIYAIYVC